MRSISRLLLLAAVAWATATIAAETLYAASVRSQVGDAASLIAGNLYTVNLSTGAFSLVGGLRTAAGEPIGVTGLADHPTSGVLYGITAAASPNHPRSLIKIDVAKAEATVVGGLGAPGSDIAFDRKGTLFVWLRATSQLATVDLASGAARPIGSPGPSSETGGIAIAANDRAYLAATGATGTLDVIDTTTGAITRGPRLQGAPYPAGINSLTLSPDGSLLAVNTNLGSPANTVLVKINAETGVVTQVAPLPNDTDALVFTASPWSLAGFLGSRHGLMLIVSLIAVGVIIGVFVGSRPKPGKPA